MPTAMTDRRIDELLVADPKERAAEHRADVEEVGAQIGALPQACAERNHLQQEAQRSARAALCWEHHAEYFYRIRSQLRTANNNRKEAQKRMEMRAIITYRAATASGVIGGAAVLLAITPLAPLGGWACALVGAALIPASIYATYRGWTQRQTMDLEDRAYREERDAVASTIERFIKEADSGKLPLPQSTPDAEETFDLFGTNDTDEGDGSDGGGGRHLVAL